LSHPPFSEPNHPKWLRWREDCHNEALLLAERVAEGKKPLIKKIYKRKAVKDLYYCASTGPFQGKCAICGLPLQGDPNADLIHYRPPWPLVHEGKPVWVETPQGPQPHPGYYWLAYHWQNLLPACGFCVKRCETPVFPTMNPPVASQDGNLEGEQAVFLNPHFDLVSDHISEDVSGLLIARTDRGKAWISFFNLNLRDRLPETRLLTRLQQKATGLKQGSQKI